MIRRCKSFHSPRPDQSYIDSCLAEFAKKRIQKRNSDYIQQPSSIERGTPVDKTQYRSSVAPRVRENFTSGLWVKPISRIEPSSQKESATKVSFAENYDLSDSRNHAIPTRCPCCKTSISLVLTNSSTGNENCRKNRAKSFCDDNSQSLERKLYERRKSCPAISSKRNNPLNRGTHKKKETVKYQFSIGFTVKRNVKSESVRIERNLRKLREFDTADGELQRVNRRRSRAESASGLGTASRESVVNPYPAGEAPFKDVSPVQLRRSHLITGYYPKVKHHRPASDGDLCFPNKDVDGQNNRILASYHLHRRFSNAPSALPNVVESFNMKTAMSKKPVRIHLLNNDSVVLVFETKSTVQQLFDQVCSLLSIKEGQFFGLSTLVDNEKWFMDLTHKIARYAPKEWGKEIRRRASDVAVSSATVLTVQFQVQFYVEHPKLIRDNVSRHLYYLQMKKNVLKSRVLMQDEILFTLASYGLQADFGDHDPSTHTKEYFRPEDYFPSWFVDKWGRDYLLSHLPSLHVEHTGKSAFESQALYIQQATIIDDVPVHYYRLTKNKKESKPTVLLGIFHQGIRIHYGNPDKNPKTPWKLEFEFMWSKVGRLFFTGKRFEIYPEDLPASRRLIYYTGSHARSKYLLHFLRDTHSTYMSLSPYAQQIRRIDGKKSESKRKYRESYISGKNLNSESADVTSSEQQSTDNEEESNKAHGDKGKLGKTCYQSMTSHGSSHTSGIESDSKQRTEGEEDEEVDNYADDFDPIEHDQRKEFINVTEDQLSGPPPKSLSVSNLANPQINDGKADETLLSERAEDHKDSSKPSRDSTLTGDDLCIPSVLPLVRDRVTNSGEQKTPKYSSVSSEDRDDTLKNGVPIEVLMSAVMQNAEKENPAPVHADVKVKKRESSKNKREQRKQVKSLMDSSTQTATPQKHPTSKFYFDDFHTIPHKPRERSRTEEPQSARELHTKHHHHHQRHARTTQSHQHEKQIAKRSSSAHSPTYKTYSGAKSRAQGESFTWLPTNRPIERTCSSDQSSSAFLSSGEKLRSRHGKSAQIISSPLKASADLGHSRDRISAFVTVSRPNKKPAAPVANGYYTVARGYDKYVYYDDVKSTALPKRPSPRKETRHSCYDHFYFTDSSDNHGRLSSFEDDDFTQKMSEVCMRTLSAQRRKLSDSKFSQRMDSGRGSLQTTTDDSSSCLDISPTTHIPPDFTSSAQSKNSPAHYDLLRTPYIENYNEVIV